MQAAAKADRDGMQTLLSGDVEFRADGGGKVPSLDKVLIGTGCVAGLVWAFENAFRERVVYRMARVNDEPGLTRYIDGKVGQCNRPASTLVELSRSAPDGQDFWYND